MTALLSYDSFSDSELKKVLEDMLADSKTRRAFVKNLELVVTNMTQSKLVTHNYYFDLLSYVYVLSYVGCGIDMFWQNG